MKMYILLRIVLLLISVLEFQCFLCQEIHSGPKLRSLNQEDFASSTADSVQQGIGFSTETSQVIFQETRPKSQQKASPSLDEETMAEKQFQHIKQAADGTSLSMKIPHQPATSEPSTRFDMPDPPGASDYSHVTEKTSHQASEGQGTIEPAASKQNEKGAGITWPVLSYDQNPPRKTVLDQNKLSDDADGQEQSTQQFNSIPKEHLTAETESEPPDAASDESKWTNLRADEEIVNFFRQNHMCGRSVYDPPIDYFRCGRCTCHDVAKDTAVYADCRPTQKVSYRPPGELPKNVEYLDLSGNHMHFFGFRDFSSYRSLLTLVLSSNDIARVDNNTCDMLLKVQSLDLSSNNISSVDDKSFSCLPDLRNLYLQNNQISKVTRLLLWGVPGLLNLDLSQNLIESIDYNAFDTCTRLISLKLSRNKGLSYSEQKLAPRIFTPLKQLKVLHVQGFLYTSNYYPTAALLELTSLEELSVDGVTEGHFQSNLTTLRNLSTLMIGVDGKCVIKSIYDAYFEGLPNLTCLQISGCVPENISHLAFSHNSLLEDLNYTDTRIGSSMFDHLYGLQDKPLKNLTLNNVVRLRSKMNPCIYLTADHVKYIKNMTRLEKLSLDDNQISKIDYDFIGDLPSTLKELSVKKNTLSYINSLLKSHDPQHLPNLVSLNEDLQNHYLVFDENEESDTADMPSPRQAQSCPSQTSYACENLLNEFKSNTAPLRKGTYVPPNLRFYTSYESFNFGFPLLSYSITKNGVSYYDISNTYATNWGSKKLSQWIEHADLSDNFCDSLPQSFFRVNNSLRELRAAGNFLGNDFADDFEGKKLSRLTGVQYVDFSRNHISDLPLRFFEGLVAVRVINLSNNKIKTFDVRMAHMTSLTFLNLSTNAITSIGRHSRDDLDLIALDHSVSLDLTLNPLPCTCSGIELLKWLATTNVRVINKDFLLCDDESTGKKQFIGNLTKRTTSLQRTCASKAYIVLIASFSITLVVLLFGAVWLFRNRWWLYYMRNIMISKFFGYRPENHTDEAQRHQFDAYILYTAADSSFVMGECLKELEVKRGHRLCVEHRDFLLGSYMPCTITSAISNSKVTMPVISPEFWDGEWSEYGLQMAVMESVHTQRNVLHLFIYKQVDMEEMPRNILKVYNDNEFSEYPPKDCSDDVKKAFWDALSRVIGHSRVRQNAPDPEP